MAGSCRFPNAPDDVWPALRCRHIVIHKPLRASIGFNLFKNNVLRDFLGARPSAGHLQEKTFRPVDKLCLSLGQPVTCRREVQFFNPAPLLRWWRTSRDKPLKSQLFQLGQRPPSGLSSALASVDEIF